MSITSRAAIVAAILFSFLAGTKYRSSQSIVETFQQNAKITSAEFDDVLMMSSSEPNRNGRVVGVYLESEDGVHDKLVKGQSRDDGTFVIIPGRINGVKIRIVATIDPPSGE